MARQPLCRALLLAFAACAAAQNLTPEIAPAEAPAGMTSASSFTPWTQSVDSFDQMGLRASLIQGINDYGWAQPTAVQQLGIVPFARGLDIIQQVPVGTGRTVYCPGILQRLDYRSTKVIQVLVVAATRERAAAIGKLVQDLTSDEIVTSHIVQSSSVIRDDVRALRDGAQVVAGVTGMYAQTLAPDVVELASSFMIKPVLIQT